MTGFLLDTNVPSEPIRSLPDPVVENWIYSQDESILYMSVITIGEIRRGVSLLAPSKRRTALEAWLDFDLLPRFRERILPVTLAIA